MSIATTGTIEHLDPSTLNVETNVRAEVTLDKEFTDSISANGVIVPIVGWRDSDGAVHVRYGQRRTRAAQTVGLATVPVYIVPIDETDTAQRIVEQLVENDQRADLTTTERVEAWRALELEGLSVATIAKRTGTKRATIKTGLSVAASDTGTRLIGEVGLTLDQAATLIEFEDDPAVVESLTRTATENPGYFAVAVEKARHEREDRAAREAAEQIEAAKGHRILSSAPGWDEAQPYRLRDLLTAEGTNATAADVEGKEGVAVHVSTNWERKTVIAHYVDDPEALGLTRDGRAATKGPMTDEQKAERKTLIANNKEWDAAETVRREWLASLISRKTLPKNAAQVIAAALTEGRYAVSTALSHGNSLAKTLLGLEDSYSVDLAAHTDAHPTKAMHVSLAIVLGGLEESTSRESWRHPKKDTARYLAALADWGHTLSPVERIAAMLPDES